MMGSMVDRDGNVKGVLQLMNKTGDEPITEQDQHELAVLLPALGEIIRTADESMEITRLCYALRQCMSKINSAIFDKDKVSLELC